MFGDTGGLAADGYSEVDRNAWFPDYPVPTGEFQGGHSVHQVFAIAGGAVRLSRTARVTAHVLWPITQAGLTPSPALTVGLEGGR